MEVPPSLIHSFHHCFGHRHLARVRGRAQRILCRKILQGRLSRKWYKSPLVTFSLQATAKGPTAAGKGNPAVNPRRRGNGLVNSEQFLMGMVQVSQRCLLETQPERRKSWREENKIISTETV